MLEAQKASLNYIFLLYLCSKRNSNITEINCVFLIQKKKEKEKPKKIRLAYVNMM
jgi:hypothetical protein